ncbi:MAG: PEGA domain-containing protein [Caldisericia bacterium]|nr:PEGA domain-containing protein [Caldisericia bacterium]
MSGKTIWLILVECVLLIILVVFFAPVGYLGIEVEPVGSTLFLDGNFIGHSPMYLAFITPRHYHLEIGKVATNGGVAYKGITSNLYVGRFKKTMTKYTLEPLYSYVIRSHPPGATVSIRGEVFEKETPCRISNLEEGKHEVILDLENYPSTRYIIDTKKTPENILLDFNSNYKLYCDSKPPDAQIKIDSEIVGRTPCVVEGIETGIHEFELTLRGYNSIKKMVDLSTTGNSLSFTMGKESPKKEIP